MFKKLIQLLNHEEKKIFFIIILSLVFGMSLEFISIGLLIPILSILIKGPEGLLEFDLLKSYESIIISKEDLLVTYGIIFIISFFLFKYIFLCVLNFFQLNFASKVMRRLALEIASNYLKRPYLSLKKANQSSLINNIYKQVEVFIANGFEPLMILLSELFIISGVIFFLFLYNSLAVFFILIFLVFPSILFYLFVKKKSKKYGFLQKNYDDKILKNVSDILKSIKEIKIYQKFDEFLLTFKNNFLKISHIRRKKLFLNQLPRYWIEIFLILSVCSLLFITHKFENNEDILIFLGVFSIGAFRILPSLNRIIINLQVLAFAQTSLKNIKDQINGEYEKEENKENLNHKFDFLEAKNLNFSYDDKKVLNNISFIIRKGDIIGITGKSGSGKSTLLDLIIGLIKPQKGEILFNGKYNIDLNTKQWLKNISYVPQNYSLIDESIDQNISLTLEENKIDNNLIQKVLQISELKDVIERLPMKEKSRIGDSGSLLSGGQKQRIGIARALYFKPKILILDESTSAIDNETEKKIFNNFKVYYPDMTIIVVSHKLTTLEYCNKILNVFDK